MSGDGTGIKGRGKYGQRGGGTMGGVMGTNGRGKGRGEGLAGLGIAGEYITAPGMLTNIKYQSSHVKTGSKE